MLVAPSDVEGFAIFVEAVGVAAFTGNSTETLIRVDGLDTRDGGELEAGFTGVFKELHRASTNDSVVGHELGGFEVALEVSILHELDVAEVHEAFTADRI